MSTNQNTTFSFDNASEFANWLNNNLTSKSDKTNAIHAYQNLSKLGSEKRAAAYVASQLVNGVDSDTIRRYSEIRTAGK